MVSFVVRIRTHFTAKGLPIIFTNNTIIARYLVHMTDESIVAIFRVNSGDINPLVDGERIDCAI